MDRPPVVAVLGAGALGSAMAMRLGRTHHEVRIWNRSAERARLAAAAARGLHAVESLSDAVKDADVVLTVLRDGPAVREVMSDALGFLDEAAIWVQASTVGPDHARALADLAAQRHIGYLDAPVSGSTEPARQGKLIWLVAGDEDVLARARPVLEDLGSSVLHVGTGVEASALKLVVNAWMTAATVALSDVLALCDALGIAHEQFARALQAGPLAMPYALQKLAMMDEAQYPAGFAVQLALKDVQLAEDHLPSSEVLQVTHEHLERAVAAGHGNDDLAAVDSLRALSRS